MMKKFALVIFDCDGVLVDSEPLANTVFARHLNRLGLSYTPEQAMQQFMGKSLTTCMQEVSQALHLAGLPQPDNFPAQFLDHLQRETFAVLSKQVEAVSGVRQAIETITAQGILTCVASSGDHDKMRVTLGKTNLEPLFAGRIYSATQVAKGKPAPDLFLLAAAQMGVAPEQCLVVEDSPFGLQAAVAANMQAIGYCALTGKERLLSEPTVGNAFAQKRIHLIDNMVHLPRLVFGEMAVS
jgi:beta-phosphoglucomutase-like phosphatase (HAD superfamily)